MLKTIFKSIYRNLPYAAQKKLARGNPNLAFYIHTRERDELIDYYLGKYKIHINTKSDVERRLLSGSYEDDTQYIIHNFVNKNDTCIDIGANIGAITIALADAVGSKGKVIAFEPGKYFFERLHKNINANTNLTSVVELCNSALANDNTTLLWQESTTVKGTATTALHGLDPNAPSIPIIAAKLDSHNIVQKHSPIHFIKIDVDGIEYEILCGSKNILQKDHPILLIETNLWNQEMAESSQKMEHLLNELNYQLFRIEDKTFRLIPTQFPNFSVNTLAIYQDTLNSFPKNKKDLFR